MNKTSNQLETVFQEVSDYFVNIPHITVTPGEGTPPDQYTITYQITGVCKEGDGDVYSCANHVITISLPFGFPHFPPNCMPESLTFHPDFDSSAICIGDVWESEKSIVKLILHIGRMISGEIYSKSNAFNEEAVEWYNANSSQLPFDSTDFEELAPAAAPAMDEGVGLESIDTLNDEDFGASFSLEQDEGSATTLDTDHLRVIAKQKRFQALTRELESTNEQFEGRGAIEQETQTAMDKAMALFQEAEVLEHQGEQQKALEKYQAIEDIVSDHHKIQEAKERVQQSFDLLGDWVSGKSDGKIKVPIKEPEDQATESEKITSISKKRTFFEDSKAVSKKLFLFALGGGSIALLVTLVFSYFSLGSSLQKAGKRYVECQGLLDANNFQGAEQKCEEALSLTAEVRIVKQNEKEELSRKIQSLLDSPKLRQGLLGNTLVDGKYVSDSTKELLLGFKEAKKNGDSFFAKEYWNEATSSYTKALDIAKRAQIVDDTQLAEIRLRLPRAQFNALMQAGEKSLTISDWSGATESFGKALQLAKANPHVLPEDNNQLELLSNQAEFNTLRDLGHAFFNNGEWDAALESYQGALDLVEKLDLSESDTLSNLQENIAKTTIYMTIEKGKKAFAASQWDEVIIQYEKAIFLLEENSKLLSKTNTKESRLKLSRIMLHAAIIKDKQDIAKLLKSDEYASVIEKLNHITQSITESQFGDQEDFQMILKEVAAQEKDAKKQLRLIEQTTYLIDNYETLFLKHHPAAARSTLSAPKVEYLRNIGSKLLFRMQCTETSGGRPLRLQMDYLYSPANGSWSFYSEE